jgi:MoxR-like ATPase
MVPSLENGKIVYLESGLVTAVKHGFILVLDEADKAPLSVTYVLKSLIQDGFMVQWKITILKLFI